MKKMMLLLQSNKCFL